MRGPVGRTAQIRHRGKLISPHLSFVSAAVVGRPLLLTRYCQRTNLTTADVKLGTRIATCWLHWLLYIHLGNFGAQTELALDRSVVAIVANTALLFARVSLFGTRPGSLSRRRFDYSVGRKSGLRVCTWHILCISVVARWRLVASSNLHTLGFPCLAALLLAALLGHWWIVVAFLGRRCFAQRISRHRDAIRAIWSFKRVQMWFFIICFH